MPPVEIRKGVYSVGAVDWNVRDFHGYSTESGTSYNSYLVMDDKITLFDAVKRGFYSDLLHNIRRVVDPRKIDYIVVNHVEMDHSGVLPELVDIVRPAKLFCSKMGKAALLAHFHKEEWPYEVVEDRQEISLGNRSVMFLETRMLHWPDSMFSYIKEDKLLVSNDMFGQHWATSERFADEAGASEVMRQAAKYYANIFLPLSSQVQKILTTIKDMGLEIEMIAPDHGLIWRHKPEQIIQAYDRWSKQQPARKALIIYDTMWRSTEMMAKAIYEGLLQEQIKVRMMSVKDIHATDVLTEVLDAKALIVGSSTLNNGMLPDVAGILTYLKGLRPLGKIGAAFGSYGWSGEAVKLINRALAEMKIDVVDDGVRVKYVPDHEVLRRCVQLGKKMGAAIRDSVPE